MSTILSYVDVANVEILVDLSLEVLTVELELGIVELKLLEVFSVFENEFHELLDSDIFLRDLFLELVTHDGHLKELVLVVLAFVDELSLSFLPTIGQASYLTLL